MPQPRTRMDTAYMYGLSRLEVTALPLRAHIHMATYVFVRNSYIRIRPE